MSLSRARLAIAYAETRLALARLSTRADIERRQARLWRRLAPVLARTPALAGFASAPVEDIPIVEPAAMRAAPERWNSRGLSAEAIIAAAEAAERGESGEIGGGVVAGYSTGSGGGRGVFLSSAEERAQYLGQILAKTLGGDLFRRRRIGLCLRADNALYRDVGKAGAFTFRYFVLAAEPLQRARDIEAFAPDVFIAPSHVLAELARFAAAGAFKPAPVERLFYGAEPMGERERKWIAEALGARPDPIYQATEGFLGAPCRFGTLHLNEDTIRFDFERVGASSRHRPVITDLRRRTQPMVRVRLDDLIEFEDVPCACGSPLRAIRPIEGRVGDVWRWGETLIFPREVETTLARVLPLDAHWRAVGFAGGVWLEIEQAHAPKAREALGALLAAAAAPAVIENLPPPPREVKRRRVRWSDD